MEEKQQLQINESSLTRVMTHVKNRNVAILTANRGEYPASENANRNKRLEADMRDRGYGFIKVKGRYIEGYGSDNENPVDEDSYIMVGKVGDDSDELLNHAKELGTKYDQESILHKPHDSDFAYLHGTKESGWPGVGNAENAGKFYPEKKGEFQSVLRGGRVFSFQNIDESLTKDKYLKSIKFLSPVSFSRRKETEI